MKTFALRLVLALALFAAGAVCLAEARLTRRTAEAHERLATLQYQDEDNGSEPVPAVLASWPGRSTAAETRRRKATLAYWQARQQAAADVATLDEAASGALPASGTEADPDLLFLAANTAYRATERQGGDRAALVARLDKVVQAYGDVLRVAPGHEDAAYNYEFVARLRDTVARGRGPVRPLREAPEPMTDPDLPPGPTVHGRPGAPPPDSDGGKFQTIVPMPFEERQNQAPGRDEAPRRRG
jgi:hypothetical protein